MTLQMPPSLNRLSERLRKCSGFLTTTVLQSRNTSEVYHEAYSIIAVFKVKILLSVFPDFVDV